MGGECRGIGATAYYQLDNGRAEVAELIQSASGCRVMMVVKQNIL